MSATGGWMPLARYVGLLIVIGAVTGGAVALDGNGERGLCDAVRRATAFGARGQEDESMGGGFLLCKRRDGDRALLAHLLVFPSESTAQDWVANDRYRTEDSPSLDIGDESYSAAISHDIVTAVAAQGSFVVSVDAIRLGADGPPTARRVVERLTERLAVGWRPWAHDQQPGLFFDL